MPDCSLAGELVAALFAGRGLVVSSSELSSLEVLLLLIVSISISFSSSFEATDCRADSVFGIVVSFFCSGVVCGGGGVSSEEGASRGTGFSEVISSNVSNRVRQSFKTYFKYWTSVLKTIWSRSFLAQGGRGLEDWGGVCVTVTYGSFDGSKEDCKRLRASVNEIFSVYLRVTMSFSIFHFGQSLDIATWSPWQFRHFGLFWQSSKLYPFSPHPAPLALPLHDFLVCPNFWHWKHLWGLGIYGRVSFFRYLILIFFGIFCHLIVKTYRL